MSLSELFFKWLSESERDPATWLICWFLIRVSFFLKKFSLPYVTDNLLIINLSVFTELFSFTRFLFFWMLLLDVLEILICFLSFLFSRSSCCPCWPWKELKAESLVLSFSVFLFEYLSTSSFIFLKVFLSFSFPSLIFSSKLFSCLSN